MPSSITSLIPLLIVMSLFLAVIALQARTASIAASVERLARRVNLALDDGVRAEVEAFQRRRVLASGVGATAGVATAFALAPADSSVRGAMLVLGAFGGVAVGVAAAALVHARRSTANAGPVTGRLLPVAIDDLVPVGERYGMRIALVVAAVVSLAASGALAALGDLDSVDRGASTGVALFLGIGVVSAAAWEVVARRIATSRPIAGGTQALAWSDALRSQTLRDMIALPLMAALYAPITMLAELALSAPPPFDAAIGGALGLLALATLLGVGVLAIVQSAPGSTRNPAQHYQRRLWPELAAGGAR